MGLSWGAMLCVDFALNYPEKVEKLILVSPGLNGWEYFQDSVANHHFELRQAAIQRSDTLAAARLFHKNWVAGPRRAATGLDESFLATSLHMIHHTMSRHWLEDWSQLDPQKAIDRLDQIKVPTYIIIGSEDAEDILLIADEYQKKIPHAEKIVIYQAAHLVNMERPEQFNSILRSILRQ